MLKAAQIVLNLNALRMSHDCILEDFVFALCARFTDETFPMNPADLFHQDTGTVQLGPGDVLFHEGDKGDCMYVLLKGEMDILLGSYVVEPAKEGALIGEMALIDDSPRAATAVAKSACRLAQVDRRRFDFLVQQHPHFARHVLKELADRLRHMNAAARR